MNIWYDIREVKPPKDVRVIGILLWPDNTDTGVINGQLYDIQTNTLIDRQRGRWMEINYWTYIPGSEPKEKEPYTGAGCQYCQGTPDEWRYC